MNPRQVQYAGIITLVGMALVIIAHLMRPELGAFHPGLVLVVGVLPNFGAALSLPFLMIVFAARILRPGRGKLLHRFVAALGVTLLGLTAWEVIQHMVWEYPIDPNDIAATGLGVVFAAGAYALLPRATNSANEP